MEDDPTATGAGVRIAMDDPPPEQGGERPKHAKTVQAKVRDNLEQLAARASARASVAAGAKPKSVAPAQTPDFQLGQVVSTSSRLFGPHTTARKSLVVIGKHIAVSERSLDSRSKMVMPRTWTRLHGERWTAKRTKECMHSGCIHADQSTRASTLQNSTKTKNISARRLLLDDIICRVNAAAFRSIKIKKIAS